jgi:hypothetical protein
MDFNTTIDLIIKDLREASEIIDDLKRYPGVPHLQVELAKSKCRSAGEVISLLKNIKIPVQELNGKTDVSLVSEVQPLSSQPKDEPKEEPKEEPKLKSAPVEVKTEPAIQEKPAPVSDKQPKQPETEKKQHETFILADKFESATALYEERTSNLKAEKDLSDRLKIKQITSISSAIGISDKFLFMGEIFDGNKENYAQALTRLDNVETIDDARSVIMSYLGEKPEGDAVNQLLELVKLKLGSDE